MASEVSIASTARAPRTTLMLGAALVLAVALVPWRHGQRDHDEAACGRYGDASVVADSQPRLTIEIPVPSLAMPNAFDNRGFADSRPWPSGMVIGMAQKFDDPMVLGTTGILDRLLSALRAALLPIQT